MKDVIKEIFNTINQKIEDYKKSKEKHEKETVDVV